MNIRDGKVYMSKKICYCLLVLLLACHDEKEKYPEPVDPKQGGNSTVEGPIVFGYPKKLKGVNIDQLCTGTIEELAPKITNIPPKDLSSLTTKVEPPLPQGLSISDTGIIYGQITGVYQGRHTVTLYKSGEKVSSDFIHLQMEAVDNIEHYGGSYTLQAKRVLPDLFAQNEPLDDFFTYSVQPNLPEGLTLSPSNGKISGTPVQIMDFHEYRLTVRSHACENTIAFRLAVRETPNEPPVFSETSENTNYYMPVALEVRGYRLRATSQVQSGFTIAKIRGFEDPDADTLKYRLVSSTHHNADVSNFVIDGDAIKLMIDIARVPGRVKSVYLSKYTTEDLVIEAIDTLGNKTAATVSINKSKKFHNSTFFKSEILPAGWQNNTLTPQQIASLPNLTKPKSDYRLVFAEEFDYPLTDGSNGLENLDRNIWNVGLSASGKEPGSDRYCRQIKDGKLEYGYSYDCRGTGFSTKHKVEYRYGYIEIKAFFPLVKNTDDYYANFATVLWSRYGRTGGAIDNDGVFTGLEPIPVVDIRSYLKAGNYEMDIFEYVTKDRRSYSHWYAAYDEKYRAQINEPAVRIDRITDFCSQPNKSLRRDIYNLSSCGSKQVDSHQPQKERYVAYTRGIEWTPRGYREFYRYETEYPFERGAKLNRPLETVGSDVYRLMNQLYHKVYNIAAYLHDEDTQDQLLEVAVLYQPVYLGLETWGYPPHDDHKIGYRQVKYDYIRLYKPVNNYADAEPSQRWLPPSP